MGPLGLVGSREGAEVPLQPSECEPGLAGAGVQRHRGGRRKREPNRKEEAEMGVVREREAERARERAECQAVLGTGEGGQGGSHRSLASKAINGGRERIDGKGGEADGKGCLGNRAQPPPIPTVQMGRLRLETQGPLLKATQPGPGS